MAEPLQTPTTAAGVEALIARLRDEGVGAGRTEAERLVADAQARARAIVEKAEAEAKARLEAARAEIDNHRRAGEEALAMAARDTVLDLKDQLARRFASDVGKTVSDMMRDDDMLRRMMLEIVGRARAEGAVDSAGSAEVILPRSVAGLDDLRRKPEELREGTLTHFVAASAAEMLREGVSFARADDEAEGISVRLGERGVTIDLTDRAVAAAILAHLQPRFRALMEGVVK
jgi:V/A-type H+/Na+-transporting ATPase subunit E